MKVEGSNDDRVGIALVGLGATGVAIGRALRERSDCRLVAAADLDPAHRGADLGAVLGGAPLGVPIVTDLSEAAGAGIDVAVVATTSLLEALAPLVLPMLEAGINVVSICEELGYPEVTHPALAAELDRVARRHGVSILGTGCNPGFIMDTMPLLLSALTLRVDAVDIRRSADMSRYGAIVGKFGIGLTLAEFDAAQATGRVIGHTGFEQAAGALAAGLGWEVDEIEVDAVRPAFLAPDERRGVHATVAPGTIAAVVHGARARVGGRVAIELAIHFGFFTPGDPVEPGDACVLRAADQTIEVRAPRGYESFLSTVAVAANVATAAVGLEPGLRTMAELPVALLASKGARLAGEVVAS